MTALDWLVLVAVALGAAAGFRRGLVVTASGLVGAAGGAAIGLLLGTALAASTTPAAPVVLALVGALLGTRLLGRIARRLRTRPASRAGARRSARPLGTAASGLDRLLGALLGAAVVCLMAWLVAGAIRRGDEPPVAADAVRESLVLARLRSALPSSAPLLDRLDAWNALTDVPGPRSQPGASRGIARDPDVRSAGASVVRVVGTACGRRSSGSGWVAASGIVVTNAHVIAGQRTTRVQVGGRGRRLSAVAVSFDRRDDVAVLRVRGLDAPALRFAARAASGSPVAVLGFPGDGAYRVRPGRLGAERRVLARGGPGAFIASRKIRRFDSVVRPGNSGGPLVDRDGRVVATVFGAGIERRSRQGFAVPNDAVRRALDDVRGPVGTGACAAGSASRRPVR